MNRVAFFEIHVEDPKRAIKFYSEVFDWKFIKEENFPIDYWRIENAGINGGLLQRPVPKPDQMGTNAYICSVEVEDFDKTADKIMKRGAIVALPKFAVPGKCWQGYFIDPEGNTFGIFEVDLKAK